MKIKIIVLLTLSLLVLSACGNNVKSSKVGYNELASNIRQGQRLQLITKRQQIINIKVDTLSGDIISGTNLDDPDKKIQVNLNNINKIRLYQ